MESSSVPKIKRIKSFESNDKISVLIAKRYSSPGRWAVPPRQRPVRKKNGRPIAAIRVQVYSKQVPIKSVDETPQFSQIESHLLEQQERSSEEQSLDRALLKVHVAEEAIFDESCQEGLMCKVEQKQLPEESMASNIFTEIDAEGTALESYI